MKRKFTSIFIALFSLGLAGIAAAKVIEYEAVKTYNYSRMNVVFATDLPISPSIGDTFDMHWIYEPEYSYDSSTWYEKSYPFYQKYDGTMLDTTNYYNLADTSEIFDVKETWKYTTNGWDVTWSQTSWGFPYLEKVETYKPLFSLIISSPTPTSFVLLTAGLFSLFGIKLVRKQLPPIHKAIIKHFSLGPPSYRR